MATWCIQCRFKKQISYIFFFSSIFNLPVEIKIKNSNTKKVRCIYCENFIYIKSKCSWESEICWESGIIEVLKIISNGYFHGDHLEGIINPKFQLSIICSCRDIADFNMLKIQTKIFQTRIWLYYIFLDFYAAELRLSEIEE